MTKVTDRLLDIRHLDAGYSGVPVVRDLTLHVEAGEVVVLRSHQHPLSLVLDSRYGLLAWAAAIVSALVFLFIAGGTGISALGVLMMASFAAGGLVLFESGHEGTWATGAVDRPRCPDGRGHPRPHC